MCLYMIYVGDQAFCWSFSIAVMHDNIMVYLHVSGLLVRFTGYYNKVPVFALPELCPHIHIHDILISYF